MGCCTPADAKKPVANASITDKVKEAYSSVARNGMDSEYSSKVARAFGYSEEELATAPDSNLGLSCGNPVATAHIKEGEHIVDLGSGGGLDCFLAAGKVGTSGQVVGLDMSSDMIDLAKRNAKRLNLSPPQLSFAYAQMGTDEPLPCQSGSVDCILSNCVLNLVESSRKPDVLVELYRILRPGGRLAIHDILSHSELDESLKNDMNLYIGCISGAVAASTFEKMLRDAGFQDIVLVDNKSDLNVYFQDGGVGCCGPQNAPAEVEIASSCCTPASASEKKTAKLDLKTFDANAHASSYSIYAVKPGEKPAAPLPSIIAREIPGR